MATPSRAVVPREPREIPSYKLFVTGLNFSVQSGPTLKAGDVENLRLEVDALQSLDVRVVHDYAGGGLGALTAAAMSLLFKHSLKFDITRAQHDVLVHPTSVLLYRVKGQGNINVSRAPPVGFAEEFHSR